MNKEELINRIRNAEYFIVKEKQEVQMTDKKKQKILKLVERAENTFTSYLTICQQITRLIQEETNEEIIDVLKQMSDGICVVINREDGAPLNIPVDEYLQEVENDSQTDRRKSGLVSKTRQQNT